MAGLSPTLFPRMSHYLTVNQARSTFIDFFVKSKGHTFVASSPTIPHDDPTLMFANAGMNQFKPIFLGQVPPGSPLVGLKRAANSQKCIRAGGKHNDLDDVGKDTYHHTFFEMLGNWSFGDYFKQEAIDWAMELLVEVYHLPRERLYATYFEGNPAAGLEPDIEARDLWRKHLPESHVLPGNMKDNFWEMGDTGPCGPCSEIHFDRIGGRDAASLVNASDPDVIEIWNNVFIQFNRESDGTLKSLPAKHVDTGMGLERLVSILQNKRSNYDTDVFTPIFGAIERLTGARPYMGKLGTHDQGGVDTAYRVIADHIRTLTFALTDGAVPSNVGRGYVLRRILRRGVRYGRQMLGAKTGFFAELVPVVVDRFGEAFPELTRNPQKVIDVILDEEESFGRTLDRGIRLFAEVAANSAKKTVSGEDAFKLYDTYGFPIDLTTLMAEEHGLKVDMAGYEAKRKEAEELSRSGGAKGAVATPKLELSGEQVAKLSHMGVDTTDDSLKYTPHDVTAHVRAIWNGHSFDQLSRPTVAQKSHPIGIVLERTNFYATQGGQEHDAGRLRVESMAKSAMHERSGGGEFIVESVQTFGGYVLHIGHLTRGDLGVGDVVSLHLDRERRGAIASNHTATHLANLGLRATLGEDVHQKGSLVAPDRLRFDFSHNQPVSPEELAKVESLVRDQIRHDFTVYAQLSDLEPARKVSGLRAVFGETYPNPVRVVSIGQPVDDLLASPDNPAWREVSIEFCGGTHVESTRQIGAFAIIGEEAVAKGVRRIVALTGGAAAEAMKASELVLSKISAASLLPDSSLASEVSALLTQLDQIVMPVSEKSRARVMIGELQERLKSAGKAVAEAKREQAIHQARQIAEMAATSLEPVIVGTLDVGEDRAAIQAAVKLVRDKCPSSAVMLISADHGPDAKVAIHASVPDALVKRGLTAGQWVRETASVVGGKGGGKHDNAQGGGTDASKVKEAVTTARAAGFRMLT